MAKYRLTQPIFLPKGTEISDAPHSTTYATPHGSILIPLSADATADLRFDIEEALRDGVIEEA